MFFSGYGLTTIDYNALKYYRCTRIIEDLSIYCKQILLSEAGGADRMQAVEYVKANFRPGGTIEMALL